MNAVISNEKKRKMPYGWITNYTKKDVYEIDASNKLFNEVPKILAGEGIVIPPIEWHRQVFNYCRCSIVLTKEIGIEIYSGDLKDRRHAAETLGLLGKIEELSDRVKKAKGNRESKEAINNKL